MGQVTIYLEKELETQMRRAAKSGNLSQSKWISNLIKERLADEWPDSVKKLAGAWQDFPTADDIRAHQEDDIPREHL